MGKLTGKVAVVAGGTGNVGEGIVRAFLAEEALVVVPSRTPEAIERLRGALAPQLQTRLDTIVADLGCSRDAQRLREEIARRHGPIDAVVASLGGTWEERLRLIDVPEETWRSYWESNLNPHFVTARTFLPGLADRPGASYTLLGGISAVLPIARYGVVGVNSAGQLMLARILSEELQNSQVRINQVMFGYLNTRARAAVARPEWVTADEVGRFCAYLASAEGAMVSGAVMQLGNRPPPGAA